MEVFKEDSNFDSSGSYGHKLSSGTQNVFKRSPLKVVPVHFLASTKTAKTAITVTKTTFKCKKFPSV